MTTIPANYSDEYLCYFLPTRPLEDVGLILVSGASGYIGGRLIPELIARGYRVRVMVRAASPEYQERWPEAEIVVADALDKSSLIKALAGVDVAYYLLHSMLMGEQAFAQADITVAINFREAAEINHLKRIVYLGGLGEVSENLSTHLLSRIQVAQELKKGTVAVTVLRAAIIIGSGSASFEIIRNLAKRLPIILIPRWAKNRCQPIAIRDVIKYLVGVLEVPETIHQDYDIGGGEILTYEDMLKVCASSMHINRIYIPYPNAHIQLFGYVAGLITPVPAPIARCLIEGLKNEVICRNKNIRELLPFETVAYAVAIMRALTREEQDKVYTRWSGAYPPAYELALKLNELQASHVYQTTYSLVSKKKASALFNSLCHIGGNEGWIAQNWMWSLRGLIDKILLGVGTARGRRSQSELKINDVLDFWRIEDIQANQLLLLRAEMKIPGKAWLEFAVEDRTVDRLLTVTAYYHTHTIFGKIYWYVFLPFHDIIFHDLIKKIAERC